MFYKEDVKIQLKDFGKNGFIKNRAILEMFENRKNRFKLGIIRLEI